ncbi:MAG: nitroreductase family protein [Sphaerochaeta sp.]|nr:nitroreductase family protein [Sphaerochaeta sp.]
MKQKPDYLAAIEARSSRRAYTTEPIATEKAAYLQDRITTINSESGLSIAWLEDGSKAFTAMKSYGMFKNVGSVMVMKGPETTPDLFERIGYYGQLLVLEATALGLGTCWVAGTYDKNSDLFSLEKGEKLVAVISVGNVPQEQTLKERVISRTVRRKTLPLQAFYTAEGEAPQWFVEGIKAVQKAPSAVNSQRVRFQYAKEGVTATVPGNWATDPIDMGIAKLHFSLAVGGRFAFGSQGTCEKD